MRDDLSSPNLGQATKVYDNNFFWKSYRIMEQQFARMLTKGPANVSKLTADDIAVAGTITAPKLRLTSTTDVSATSTGHAFQIGADSGTNLAMDANEIMVITNGVPSQLHLNWDGAPVAVGSGGLTTAGQISSTGTGDVSLVSTGHPFQLGPTSGANMALNFNEIQARNNSAATPLYLNWSGGVTNIGGGAATAGTVSSITLGGSTPHLIFPAAAVASAGLNTMDDYEEGDFTPTYVLTTPGTSVFTYDTPNRWGNYIKIGGAVLYHGRIRTTAFTVGTGAGTLSISGLPFSAAVSFGSGSISYYTGWTTAAPQRTYATGASVTILLDGATTIAAVTVANLTAAGANDVAFGGWYQAT